MADYILPENMTWGSFTMMSREDQQALLTYVTERFRVGTSAIARDLFQVSQHTLYRYIQRQKLEFPRNQGGRVPEALMADWKEWIAQNMPKIQDTNDVQQEIKSVDGTVEDTAHSVGDVVRSMHDLYGKIRVTIAIEPV